MRDRLRVFTIGHSNRSVAALREALAAHGASALCDVRAYPGSSRHPQFSRDNLEGEFDHYAWLGKELGGHRKCIRDDSPHTALTTEGFRNYADYMETAGFGAAIDALLERAGPVALMCAERDWGQCHRRFIADYLHGVRGVEVVHIVDARESERHSLHKRGRVVGERVLYAAPPTLF